MPIQYHSNWQFGKSYFPSTINAWTLYPQPLIPVATSWSIAAFKFKLLIIISDHVLGYMLYTCVLTLAISCILAFISLQNNKHESK